MGRAYTCLDLYHEAVLAHEEAFKLAKIIDEKGSVVTALHSIADALAWSGQFDKAKEPLDQSLVACRQIGDRGTEGWILATKGRILSEQGDFFQAVQVLTDALSLADASGSGADTPYICAFLARAYYDIDDLASAHKIAKRGIEIAGEDDRALAFAMHAMAKIETALENWRQATKFFQQSIALFLKERDPQLAGRVQVDFAKALIERGAKKQAFDLIQAAIASFQELKLTYEIEKAERLLTTNGTKTIILNAREEK
jgi:tetratricopeptide (TPR) repeat protein